jgi:sugar phosphate permease
LLLCHKDNEKIATNQKVKKITTMRIFYAKLLQNKKIFCIFVKNMAMPGPE